MITLMRCKRDLISMLYTTWIGFFKFPGGNFMSITFTLNKFFRIFNILLANFATYLSDLSRAGSKALSTRSSNLSQSSVMLASRELFVSSFCRLLNCGKSASILENSTASGSKKPETWLDNNLLEFSCKRMWEVSPDIVCMLDFSRLILTEMFSIFCSKLL